MALDDNLFSADQTPLYDDGASASVHRSYPKTSVTQQQNPLRKDGNFIELADPLNDGGVRFYERCIASRVVITVLDDPWIRRLNEVNQSLSLSYLYPSAKNCRLAHVVGVASRGIQALQSLWEQVDNQSQQIISDWAEGFALALICHDLGHVAPGSHGAYKVLFPGYTDAHERIACTILQSDTSLVRRLFGAYGHIHGLRIIEQACAIISEDYSRAPRFLVQLLSGGAWNVDRADWVPRDLYSMKGVIKTQQIDGIQGSLMVTPGGSLAIQEEALGTLESFAMARSRMLWSAFNGPVCRSFDHLAWAVAECARDQKNCEEELTPFMRRVFLKSSPFEIDTDDLFQLREHEWLCQRDRWCASVNPELRFLAQSLRDGRGPCALSIPAGEDPHVLKTIACELVEKLGFTPKYHVGLMSRSDGMDGDLQNALEVYRTDGEVLGLTDCSSYFRAVSAAPPATAVKMLVLPGDIVADVKNILASRHKFGGRPSGFTWRKAS